MADKLRALSFNFHEVFVTRLHFFFSRFLERARSTKTQHFPTPLLSFFFFSLRRQREDRFLLASFFSFPLFSLLLALCTRALRP